LLGALLAAVACSTPRGEDITGETHFLRLCDAEANDCGAGLLCACGVCTRVCEVSSDCAAFPSADCIASASSPPPQMCADPAPAGRCDVTCVSDADCQVVSGSHRCNLGFCRAGSNPGGCPTGEVEGNQVLVLGDSFMAASHQITAGVEELARGAGALRSGQRYRDESTLTGNALALGGNGIMNQYDRGIAGGSVEVAIMNGGGADVLAGSCADPPDAGCPIFTEAVAGAEELFVRMAADGVSAVVYAFYPDPVDEPMRAKMDVLRPLLQAVCEASPTPCFWLDLRPVFEGRYTEYVGTNGLNPTALGSQASAAAIWATMQEHCIAQ